MSLLGLVRHLAEVERGWFRRTMAGLDAPRIWCSEAAPDADFDGVLPDPEVVDEAWRAWRAEVEFAERFVAEAADLGVKGPPSPYDPAGPAPPTARGGSHIRDAR
ncbi:DUF664 domain-containing protein [Micromonospora sp. DT229]|uniref:mycothiol transferase n=1 Tax=Micromonospora sp. DT229 TaxID=3393430 RepID=UPI003CF19F19